MITRAALMEMDPVDTFELDPEDVMDPEKRDEKDGRFPNKAPRGTLSRARRRRGAFVGSSGGSSPSRVANDTRGGRGGWWTSG